MSASRLRRNQRRDRRTQVRALARPRLPALLLEVIDHACTIWEDFCLIFHTPAGLAEREYVNRADYARMRDWIYHLELLMRRFIFGAASLLQLVLRPIAPRTPRQRSRRRIIIWPNKPRLWPARFSMRTTRTTRRRAVAAGDPKPRPPLLPAFPLARRLEALRRIIVDPTTRIRRHAIRLARLAERNARANAPRRMRIRYWDWDVRTPTMGQRIIMTPMRIVQPLACDAADEWNEAAEPD